MREPGTREPGTDAGALDVGCGMRDAGCGSPGRGGGCRGDTPFMLPASFGLAPAEETADTSPRGPWG